MFSECDHHRIQSLEGCDPLGVQDFLVQNPVSCVWTITRGSGPSGT